MIQKAMSVMPGPDELYLTGAAWSSPRWMKTSNSYSGFGLLKEEYYQVRECTLSYYFLLNNKRYFVIRYLHSRIDFSPEKW